MATFGDYQIDYQAAVWYAFGREDERGQGLDWDADEFAKAYADHARAFREGTIGSRLSIRDAYELFTRGETLPGTSEQS